MTKRLLALLMTASAFYANAQEQRAMTFEEMVGWERITASQISNNGEWVNCKMEPWRGDGTVYLYDKSGKEKGKYTPASEGKFSASSDYLLVTMTPSKAVTDSLKLKKTDKKKMPMNSLLIRNVKGGEETIDSLRAYKLSSVADLMAYQRGTEKDSSLYVRTLDNTKNEVFPNVKVYEFAKKGGVLYVVSDSLLYTYSVQNGKSLISDTKGVYDRISFNEDGTKLAYLFCSEKDSSLTKSSVFVSSNNQKGSQVVSSKDNAFPEGWTVSGNGSLSFSNNSERLFFGTAPLPKEKDTTMFAENFPNVEVWTWNEPVLYTQQKVNKNGELKRTFTAMVDLNNKTVRQLANTDMLYINMSDRGDGKYALLTNPVPYLTESMWTGRSKKDNYLMNLNDGKITPLAQGVDYSMNFSPEGNYLVWYCAQDSSWYSYVIETAKTVRLTNPSTFTAWNKDFDMPDFPNGYGLAGWTNIEKYALIKDDYDIWKFDLTGVEAPVNVTVNGAKDKIQYNMMQLDPDKRVFDLSELQYLRGYNTVTKANGFYSSVLSKGTAPKALVSGPFNANNLKKAKDANNVIYTKESYEIFPDILLSDLSFKKSIRLTDGIAQQKDILWGTAELTSWVSLDGRELEGVIYKPANFDPNKKYPLLVNFYEVNTQTFYNYHMPSPGRSTIDYPFYISHEYIIFNPDVKYTDGYPGESCYNCVMPGVTKLIGEGYIDEKSIGAQGHSWGGYQVAYLATRTNLFAAIESGAPVVNMLSAYGGIRWASGLNRSFQYEHTQSRLGGTIWESPLRYIENSPLINMDKVTTPILIMHNDADGHVPWYQGIEYFIAMRRLQKPCWMLNYCGEPHWPSTMANRIDFQKRMFQFFDHYLKKSPMPEWMKDGVPAVDKDFELGY